MARPSPRLLAALVATLCILLSTLSGTSTGPAAAEPTVPAAVKQRGILTMMPQVSQQGVRPARPVAARSSMTSRFWPVRRGRVVLLQRQQGRRWVTVGRGRQNGAGRTTFLAPYAYRGRPVRYRATTAKVRRLRATSTWAQSTAQWRPRLTETFSGTRLDLRRWEYRKVGEPTENRTIGVSDPRAVSVGGGTLNLRVQTDPAAPRRRLLNGMVSTHYAFRYGVAAARIRFPRNQGNHGAFWLMPTGGLRYASSRAEANSEIDVVEFFGKRKDGGLMAGSFYIPEPEAAPKKVGRIFPHASRLKPRGDEWFKSYHVFSVEWTPTTYVFRIDGRELFRTSEGVSRVEEYLILSLLTSDWEVGRLNRKLLPTTMNVDWVRVWQK